MKQVLLRKGEVTVEEVPTPVVKDDNVLVQAAYSCISTGTEISAVTSSGQSLLQKALNDSGYRISQLIQTTKISFEV